MIQARSNLLKALCACLLFIALLAQAQIFAAEPPVITRQPASQEVDAGRSVFLSVDVTGTSPISFRWFRNDDPIPNAIYYYFSQVMTPELAGNYSVLVSNEAGTVMSDPALVTVRVYPPTINDGPNNVSVLEGQTAELAISANGAPLPTYTWFFNGTPIPGKTNYFLQIPDVRLQDAGSYFATLSNSEGSVTSSTATVTVMPAKTNGGSVDISFRPGTGANGVIQRLALQSDGKILAAGQFTRFNGTNQQGCVRLQVDGPVDESFIPSGFVPGDIQFLAEAPGGKIVANRSPGTLVRWNSDGSIDPDFVLPSYSSARTDVVGLQSDGRIVLAPSSSHGYSFVRLQTSGAWDLTYNTIAESPPGGSTGPPTYVIWGTVLSDGKILVMGDAGFFRIHRHGARDSAFRASSGSGGLPGKVLVAAERDDKKVFVAGTFTNIGGLPRSTLSLLHPDGTPDNAFIAEVPPPGTIRAMAVQPDGKLLIAGTFTSVASVSVNRIARLNTDGTLDRTFDCGAGANGTVSTILLQPDCKILLAGSFTGFDGYPRGRIVRLNMDPQRAPLITRQPTSQVVTAGTNALLIVEASCNPPAAVQWLHNQEPIPDGTNRVLRLPNVSLASAGDYHVVLSNALGVVTSAVAAVSVNLAPTAPAAVGMEFAVGTGADSTIRAMARQSNGKLIVAGWFAELHGVACPGIARLNADGSVDRTFDAGTGPDNRILGLAIDSNDRVLVGGTFTNFNGLTRNRLVRLNPNGDVDASFQIGSGFTGGGTAVNTLALQPDGRILAGGNFSSFNNTNRQNIVRLHPGGAVDASFLAQGNLTDVLSIAIQQDGRILVGQRTGLKRFETNGVSSTLTMTLPISGEVRSLLIQPDQQILVGGLFYFGAVPAPVPAYALTRLTPTGTVDTNFYHALYGAVQGAGVESLRLHTCGRILVGGYFMTNYTNPAHYHVARLEQNGMPDRAFAAKAFDGTVRAVDVEPSTDIVIGGDFSIVDHTVRNGLARLHAEPLGPPTIFAHPVTQTASGGSEVLLSVLVTNCIDFTFQWQVNGTNIPNATNSTLLMPSVGLRNAGDYRVVVRNGPYVSVSEPAQLQVLREPRHPGSTDIDFFGPRSWNGWVHALALDSAGKLLVGGAFTTINGVGANRLARFNWDGDADSTFRVISNFTGTIYSLGVQSDGKILAAGDFSASQSTGPFLRRHLPDGRVDTNFSRLAQFQGIAHAVIPLPDGKILVGGSFTAAGIAVQENLTRVLTNGNPDLSFNAAVSGRVLAVARRSDGSIILGGTFTRVSNQPRPGLARVVADGPIDPTFNPGAGANSPVMAVVLAHDEKPYIGGNFTAVDGVPRVGVARLNHDGTVDTSFDPGLGVHSVWALAIQPDHKLLVGGSFLSAGGLPRSGIARFNTDGTIDPMFDPGSGVDGQVFALLCDPTGKIYLGGNFTTYNGLARDHVARANGDLLLLNPKLVGAAFQVSLFTFYGQSYALEFKPSLTDSEWIQSSALLGDGAIRTLTDPGPAGLTRWYRVRTEP